LLRREERGDKIQGEMLHGEKRSVLKKGGRRGFRESLLKTHAADGGEVNIQAQVGVRRKGRRKMKKGLWGKNRGGRRLGC